MMSLALLASPAGSPASAQSELAQDVVLTGVPEPTIHCFRMTTQVIAIEPDGKRCAIIGYGGIHFVRRGISDQSWQLSAQLPTPVSGQRDGMRLPDILPSAVDSSIQDHAGRL
jgi:hypothetical protein